MRFCTSGSRDQESGEALVGLGTKYYIPETDFNHIL